MSRGKTLIAAFCLVLALAIAGCGSDDSSTTDAATDDTTASAESSSTSTDLSKKPEITVPDGPPPKELVENEIVEGDGEEVILGSKVTVQYVGAGYETGEEFDASWDRGEPFTFSIGDREVIEGWDQGLRGMKVGGRRELIVPPELAYGPAGAPPAIGPNETLIFVVDLVKVVQP
ncbi:MAG TPA: FKBP-type peptidyl-prolyl cis-trans isomerase [Solirubrobacterales bacterium]|nr:FKBP-type peptidyl-prolyl cis-trans isomerase [Solirubrobacterales bacterium]